MVFSPTPKVSSHLNDGDSPLEAIPHHTPGGGSIPDKLKKKKNVIPFGLPPQLDFLFNDALCLCHGYEAKRIIPNLVL